jgi:hypothetical protein
VNSQRIRAWPSAMSLALRQPGASADASIRSLIFVRQNLDGSIDLREPMQLLCAKPITKSRYDIPMFHPANHHVTRGG